MFHLNDAGGIKASHKFFISMIGLFTGLLLFTGSFSMLLNNTVFNSGYYKTAFEKLGTYSLIAEMAGNPAKDITAKISESSDATALSTQTADSVKGQQKALMKSLVEDNVSEKMVRLNVNSLIDGLLKYFKGETGSLPDLQFVSPATLKSVNLQVLIMYMGESRISCVLHLVSLSQYTLVHIPTFLLFLFPIIMVYMLKKTPGEIKYWVLSSAFFYGLICLAVGLLTQQMPYILLKNIPAEIYFTQFSPVSGLLSSHIFYFANVLTFYIFLSGILLFMGVKAAIQANKRYINYEKPEPVSFPKTRLKRRTVLILTIVLISVILFYINLQSSSLEFNKRNLGQTLAQLWENNPIYRVTDARNDLVYLLEVHIVDNNNEKPLADVGINITKGNNRDAVYHSSSTLTDSAGTAVFILDKGPYTLSLDSYNMFTGFGDTQSHSYQFEMLTPGKSELNVILGEKNTGLPYLAEASLQFIP
jgi:5-hydroxyisourate hydrolase-like protein (transthyretin family)